MAVVATHRCRIMNGRAVEDRESIRRMEASLALTKLAAVAALALLAWGVTIGTRCSPRTVVEESTGSRIYRPSHWEETSAGLAKEFDAYGDREWPGDRIGSRPRRLAVRLMAFPLDGYGRGGPCARDLPPACEWDDTDLVAALTAQLGFASDGLVVRSAQLMGGPAVELSGPRIPGDRGSAAEQSGLWEPAHWGSAVARAEGDYLLVYEVAAPDERAFREFEPTWRRMVGRTGDRPGDARTAATSKEDRVGGP